MSSDSAALSAKEECRVGGYVLLRPIGKGSFSKVMLARHLVTGSEVAVKIMNRRDSGEIFREVTSLKMLHHPNIIKLFEVIDTQDETFLFMENVSSGHLLKYLQKNYPIAEEDARAIFREMTSAVHYCHIKGIAHRDLKLENILLDGENHIRVVDFGFSTRFAGDKRQTFCGTLSYMAPEILKSKPYDARKADAWSMGVILYVLLTGRRPFEGTHFEERKQKILSGHFHIPDSLSVECQELLKKLLTVDPSHRITVEGIMEDQWVNIGYEEALRPYSEPPWGDTDPQVIEMMEKLGYQKEEIEDSVCHGKYDDIMGTYMILKNRQNKVVGRKIRVRPCPSPEPSISPCAMQGALALGWKLEDCSCLPHHMEASVPSPPPHMERRTRSLPPNLERRMFVPSSSLQVGGFIPFSSLEMTGTTDTDTMEAREPSPSSLMATWSSFLPSSLEMTGTTDTDMMEARVPSPSLLMATWSSFLPSSLETRRTIATDSSESRMTISPSHPRSRMARPQDSPDSPKSIPRASPASGVTSSLPSPGPRTTSTVAHSSSCIRAGTPASPSGSSHGQQGVGRRVLRFFLKCFCCWPSSNKQHHKRKRVQPI